VGLVYRFSRTEVSSGVWSSRWNDIAWRTGRVRAECTVEDDAPCSERERTLAYTMCTIVTVRCVR
jgi:hypothetical protein